VRDRQPPQLLVDAQLLTNGLLNLWHSTRMTLKKGGERNGDDGRFDALSEYLNIFAVKKTSYTTPASSLVFAGYPAQDGPWKKQR
jgi:hypothetical protein